MRSSWGSNCHVLSTANVRPGSNKKKQTMTAAFFNRYFKVVLANFLCTSCWCCFLWLNFFLHRLHINVCQNPSRMFIDHDLLFLSDLSDLLRRDYNVTTLSSATN